MAGEGLVKKKKNFLTSFSFDASKLFDLDWHLDVVNFGLSMSFQA